MFDEQLRTRKQNSAGSMAHAGGEVRVSVRRNAGWNWRPKLLHPTSPAPAAPKLPTITRTRPFMRRAASSCDTASTPG